MTSKQRSYLKGLAMTIDPIFQLGKSSLTPENTKAIEEALNARELIKINVLQNCCLLYTSLYVFIKTKAKAFLLYKFNA